MYVKFSEVNVTAMHYEISLRRYIRTLDLRWHYESKVKLIFFREHSILDLTRKFYIKDITN